MFNLQEDYDISVDINMVQFDDKIGYIYSIKIVYPNYYLNF